MKISVIIPAWKAQDFLKRCIDSIEKQTVQPDEILIGIDSCQSTLDKCREIAAKNDKVKLYYFPEHIGCYRIRNTLATLANGELIVLFDADDAMYENYIEKMGKITSKGCFARPMFINNIDGRITQNTQPAEGCIAIMREDIIYNAGWEPWVCAADSEFRERALRQGMKWKSSEEVIFVRFIHDNNLTRGKGTDMKSAYRKNCKKEILDRRECGYLRDTIAIGRCLNITAMEEEEKKEKHITKRRKQSAISKAR